MDIRYSIDKIFPVPIHTISIDNFSQLQTQFIELAYQERIKNQGRTASNVGGYQSKPFLLRERNDVLSQTLLNIITNLPCFKKSIEFDISAWVNINKSGDSNQNHNHPATNLAGVLWIKIPKNSGNIKLLSPYNFTAYGELFSYIDEFQKQTNCYYDYKYEPKEGAMIIFPAHLIHKVEENKSNEDRISVSFNIDLLNFLE
tara:strand:- start:2569 stop:3171 length:603 start_codon:yes stop_codon:yes gene_type:complete